MTSAPGLQEALALLGRGQAAEARRICLGLVAAQPGLSAAWTVAGLAAAQLREWDDAERCFGEAAAREAAPGQARLQLARLRVAAHRWGEALQPLAELCAAPPANRQHWIQARAWYGQCLYRVRRFKEAAEILEGLLREEPGLTQIQSVLGSVYLDMGRADDAIRCWAAVLQRDPDHQDSALSLARVLCRRSQAEQAERLLDQIIARVRQRGTSALSLTLERALLAPPLHRDAAEAQAWRRRWEREARGLARLEVRQADALDALGRLQVLFYAHYACADDRPTQSAYGALLNRLVRVARPEWLEALPGSGGGRIRVGFCSAHLVNHTIYRLFSGWVRGLDRSRFEVRLYHLGQDAWTRGLAAEVDGYRLLRGAWAEDVAALRAEGLDALIYPEIGMHPQIMAMAAARCAPVQAVAWGHPVTTGLPTIDAFLSSADMEPPDGERHYTERLVRLPGLSLALEPPPLRGAGREGAAVAALRASFGLPADRMLLLCTQSLFKLLPENDTIFAEILAACPRASLVLLGAKGLDEARVKDRLRAAVRAIGADPARVTLLEPCPHDRFLDLNACADVFLDGLAWSGGQTTLEAVACGLLPVCTEGRWMRTRHTAAILRAIGLPELVADRPAGVVPILKRLHDDPAHLAAMRARLEAGRGRLWGDARVIPALESWLAGAVGRDPGIG